MEDSRLSFIKTNDRSLSAPSPIMKTCIVLLAALVSLCFAQVPSSKCIEYFSPPGAISVTGTWSIQANIKDEQCRPIHVAGMRGIFPQNNTQVPIVNGDVKARVLQAFQNMLFNAASRGAGPQDCAEVIVFVSDMVSIRPIVNAVQAQLWNPTGVNPAVTLVYPPRTILQLTGFNGLTCRQAGTANPILYYQGTANSAGQVVCNNANDIPIGDILEVKGTFYIKKHHDDDDHGDHHDDDDDDR